MPRRIPILRWTDRTEDKIWEHGLIVDDALAVARRSPLLRDQDPTWQETDTGEVQMRPPRVLMIGPGRTDRLLTFVLSYPDDVGESLIVTGWPSGRKERSWYLQSGRGRR